MLKAAHRLAKRATQVNEGTSYHANLGEYMRYLARYGAQAEADLHMVLEMVMARRTRAERKAARVYTEITATFPEITATFHPTGPVQPRPETQATFRPDAGTPRLQAERQMVYGQG